MATLRLGCNAHRSTTATADCLWYSNGLFILVCVRWVLAAPLQGISAVETMCGRKHVLNHLSVPAACFTHPEVRQGIALFDLGMHPIFLISGNFRLLRPDTGTGNIRGAPFSIEHHLRISVPQGDCEILLASQALQ